MEKYLRQQLEIRNITGLAVSFGRGERKDMLALGRGISAERSFDIGSVVKTAIATEVFMKAERAGAVPDTGLMRKLSHTSGMRDEGGPLWPPEEERFCYCERAYDEILAEELGGKLSIIKRSVFPPAEAYEKDSDRVYRRTEPGPGFYADIYELTDYAEKQLRGEYLSRAYYDLMWKERAPVPDSGEHIACGWFVAEREGKKYYGHEGGAKGFRSSLYICPEEESFVIVLANCSGAATKKIAFGILSRL